MKKRILSGIVFAAVLSLFMATAMAGNGGNVDGNKNMIQEDCRWCHITDEITSVSIHHPPQIPCTECHRMHVPGEFYRKDCKLCHVDVLENADLHYDKHFQPQKRGGKCASCHNLNAGAGGAGEPGQGASECNDQSAVHSGEETCSDCHSWQSGENQNEAGGSQHQRGR